LTCGGYDDNCFSYDFWRNDAVTALGTLSSHLFEDNIQMQKVFQKVRNARGKIGLAR